MGSERTVSGVGGALFTATQQRVLGLLFGRHDRSFYTKEVVRLTGGGSGAVQRELDKLHAAGLVTERRVGNQRHYQADPGSPIFDELRSIVTKTFGLADLIRGALGPLADRIDVAFIFGSVAAGTDTARSDVDLFLLGRGLSYADVMAVLAPAERSLGRTLSPVVYSAAEVRTKLRGDNAFLSRLMDGPRIFLVGSASDLPG